MAKEHFVHAETPALLKKLDELARRSHMSRGQAFEDWITAMVCALAAEKKEAEYLAMVERHKEGKPGVDLISEMFAELVFAMEKMKATCSAIYSRVRSPTGRMASFSRQTRCVHDASRFTLSDRIDSG